MIKHSSTLKVNIRNIQKNYEYFKNLKKNIIVAPTIKANAYGLGAKKIFNLFLNNKCKHFFVATLEEGIELNNKKNAKIYVLNGIQNYDVKFFKRYNLIPIINNLSELKIIFKNNLKFGLHIDTGINRLGISLKELPKKIFNSKNIEIVISHLSSADERNNRYNTKQKNKFLKIINKFESNNIIFSLSNTNGSVLSKEFLFDMIRPGIGLYGGNNQNKILNKKLKPVVTLSGKIIQIKIINKNEYIGYNQTYQTKKNIKIAIVGFGYADGIPRALSNKGTVYYKNEKFKIIGRISMDSFTIDITQTKHNLKVGMFIDLINKNNGIESFANQCETISNEVITSIGARVKRFYVK